MNTAGLATFFRQARDAGAWRPSNARLLMDQIVGRGRNSRAGYRDADHLAAAAAWLERAQDATGNGGVAGRYRLRSGWTAAYPETTGYIVPTFLALAKEPGGDRFRLRAERAIEFLLPLQLADGAFPGGELGADTRGAGSFFNTGQILAGLIAWHRATGDARALGAARRAGDWLCSLQEPDGAFRRNLYHGVVTTYGAHSSCWLAELGAHLDEPRYQSAAVRHLTWTLAHIDPDTGWIDRCGFLESHHQARVSVTHTLAYTLWGMLATARLAAHAEGLAAVERAALAAARRLELSGFLPGVLDARWRPAASYACLTGNAQMALVWFALYDLTGDMRLLNAALKAIDLVKRAQPMVSSNPGIRGGIPGSDPIWGDYIRMAVPNWSAKFFIDAVLQKSATLEGLSSRPRTQARQAAGVPCALPEPASSPAAPVRIVILATPSSAKLAHMLRTWSWGFRPAGAVILSRPRRSLRQRIRERMTDGGGRGERPGEKHLHTDRAAAGRADARALCRERGIPIVEVDSFDTPAGLEAIRALRPDLFVFAGGAILRPSLLALPRLGTVNAHMGLLPFYRGMNVAEWARLHGDRVGCSVHLIDAGIDTGDILCVRPVPLDGVRTVVQLRERVDHAQMALLGEVVSYVAATGALPPGRPQEAGEGRQFFRMHHELLGLLARELASAPEGAPDQGHESLARHRVGLPGGRVNAAEVAQ